MRPSRQVKAAATVTALVVLSLAAGGLVVAKPTTSTVGNLETEFGGSVYPKALPSKKPAPISSLLWGKVRTLDGTNPSALTELRLMGDDDVELDLARRPKCRLPIGGRRSPADIRKYCAAAIVATGRIEGIVVFPGEIPVDFESELVVVKGDSTTLYAYAYFSAPVTSEVVIPIEVKKVSRGGFGTETVASFPKIAGGSGSVTYFKLFFERGVLRATCSGRQLHARITAAFRDGTKASAALASPCTSKDAGARSR